MRIDIELVHKLASLSRIELQDVEQQKILKDLNRILDLVDKLNELDTSNVEPLVHMTDEMPKMRSDIIQQSLTKKDVLRNAPLKDEDFFKVPKVVKK